MYKVIAAVVLFFLLPMGAKGQKHVFDGPSRLYGQPGVQFMQRLVPWTGDSVVEVVGLPKGLRFDKERSCVAGCLQKEGDYSYVVRVAHGGRMLRDSVRLTISRQLQQPAPFMGWLSWNVVESEISTEVVRTVAEAMAASGLKRAGYRYLVVDDLWHADSRDTLTHSPLADKQKFPNGMEEAVAIAHAKGLRFGIYSDAADRTCAGRYGSYGYEKEDATQYAQWGVDLLKYDYCHAPTERDTALERYRRMGEALEATGRKMLYYMCEWGQRQPWLWGEQTGASCWRTTYDTRDGWTGKWGGVGVVQSIEGMRPLWPYSGVNRWNDADMLCIGIHGRGKSSSDLVEGRPGMTQDEYATQMALWCLWSSPLTLSFDLRKPISPDDIALMTNPELLALDQDLMGQQAQPLWERNGLILWVKPLENGDVALGLTNMNDTAARGTIKLDEIPYLDHGKHYHVRDVMHRFSQTPTRGEWRVALNRHQTAVYRLAEMAEDEVTGEEYRMQVREQRCRLKVEFKGAENAPKRIVVTDPYGRVLSEQRGSGQRFRLPLPKEEYVVRAVAQGRACCWSPEEKD